MGSVSRVGGFWRLGTRQTYGSGRCINRSVFFPYPTSYESGIELRAIFFPDVRVGVLISKISNFPRLYQPMNLAPPAGFGLDMSQMIKTPQMPARPPQTPSMPLRNVMPQAYIQGLGSFGPAAFAAPAAGGTDTGNLTARGQQLHNRAGSFFATQPQSTSTHHQNYEGMHVNRSFSTVVNPPAPNNAAAAQLHAPAGLSFHSVNTVTPLTPAYPVSTRRVDTGYAGVAADLVYSGVEESENHDPHGTTTQTLTEERLRERDGLYGVESFLDSKVASPTTIIDGGSKAAGAGAALPEEALPVSRPPTRLPGVGGGVQQSSVVVHQHLPAVGGGVHQHLPARISPPQMRNLSPGSANRSGLVVTPIQMPEEPIIRASLGSSSGAKRFSYVPRDRSEEMGGRRVEEEEAHHDDLEEDSPDLEVDAQQDLEEEAAAADTSPKRWEENVEQEQ